MTWRQRNGISGKQDNPSRAGANCKNTDKAHRGRAKAISDLFAKTLIGLFIAVKGVSQKVDKVDTGL